MGSYLNYIENLPLMDDVEAFSLHQNANIIFQRKESKEYLDALLSMEPAILTDSPENAHELLTKRIQEILNDLPSQMKISSSSDVQDPMVSFNH